MNPIKIARTGAMKREKFLIVGIEKIEKIKTTSHPLAFSWDLQARYLLECEHWSHEFQIHQVSCLLQNIGLSILCRIDDGFCAYWIYTLWDHPHPRGVRNQILARMRGGIPFSHSMNNCTRVQVLWGRDRPSILPRHNGSFRWVEAYKGKVRDYSGIILDRMNSKSCSDISRKPYMRWNPHFFTSFTNSRSERRGIMGSVVISSWKSIFRRNGVNRHPMSPW